MYKLHLLLLCKLAFGFAIACGRLLLISAALSPAICFCSPNDSESEAIRSEVERLREKWGWDLSKLSNAGRRAVIAAERVGANPLWDDNGRIHSVFIEDSSNKVQDHSYLADMHDLADLTVNKVMSEDSSWVFHIKGLRKLARLEINDSSMSDSGWEIASKLPELAELTVMGANVSEPGLKMLADSPKLEKLDMRHTPVSDNGLVLLSAMQMLKTITLSHTKVSPNGLLALKNTSVEEVVWRDGRSENAHLPFLARIPSIRRVYCDNASHVDLKHIGGMVELTSLHLTNPASPALGFSELAKLTGMRDLGITFWPNSPYRGSDAMLGFIDKMTGLYSLDLSHTALTDSGLKNMRSLSNLRELRLFGTLVTSSAIEDIEKFSELEALDISLTPMLDESKVLDFRRLRKLKTLRAKKAFRVAEVLVPEGCELRD